jgi:membrane associated rhomboid family serine protease
MRPEPHRNSADEEAEDIRRLRSSFSFAGCAVVLLWTLRLLEDFTGLDLEPLMLWPRETHGLVGIVTAPLLHGDFTHLLSNTLPLLLLGTGLLYLYPRSAPVVIATVYLLSGLAVWLFARPAAHLGASGLTYGFVTFLFFSGAIRRQPPSIGLALIVAFLYGSTIWGILPIEQGISFESHLAGAILGLLCAVLLRKWDRGAADADAEEPAESGRERFDANDEYEDIEEVLDEWDDRQS